MAGLIPLNAEGSSTESDYRVGTINAGVCAHTARQHPNHGEQLDRKFVDASQNMYYTVEI
jgi:hypothetical protein